MSERNHTTLVAAEVQTTTSKRTRGEAFSALLKDRISHGAFRLWHILRDHENVETGNCCPGYRTLTDEIRCSRNSIKGWLDELRASGWVDWVVTTSRPTVDNPSGRMNSYRLLDGAGAVVPKQRPPTAQNSDHRWLKTATRIKY